MSDEAKEILATLGIGIIILLIVLAIIFIDQDKYKYKIIINDKSYYTDEYKIDVDGRLSFYDKNTKIVDTNDNYTIVNQEDKED